MNDIGNSKSAKLKEFLNKHSSSFKKTFLEELKVSSESAKMAYSNLIKLINNNDNITNEERERIGDDLKGVLKRTLTKLGLVGVFFLPGGSIFLILMKFFKNKKPIDSVLPFDEVDIDNKKIRIFSESTDSNEFKWHRDMEDRKVTILDGEGWSIQFDNNLPQILIVGQEIIIPEGVYHRVIKGKGELKVSIEFI